MEASDAAIIGAGPSGLYLARELSRIMNVVVFEEDKELGLPLHCTGLVNADSLKVLSISPPIINSYRYVRVTDLEGNSITFDFKRNAVAMLNRPGLENYLADELGSASLALGKRVLDVQGNTVRTKTGETTYDLVIIAEGSSISLTKNLIPWKPTYVYGVQTDAKSYASNALMPRDINEIVVVFDRRLSNHFFAWIVPRDNHELRIGIADDANTWVKFVELLRITGVEHYNPFGGKVIISGSPDNVVTGSVAVIGDAAGFVKPTTGGGIIMGMLSAKLLAESIYSVVREGLRISDALSVYNMVFRKFIKNKVRALGGASSILHLMVNSSLGEVMHHMNTVNVEIYDYDNHIDAVLRAAMRRPLAFAKAMFSLIGELSLVEPNRINELIRELLG